HHARTAGAADDLAGEEVVGVAVLAKAPLDGGARVQARLGGLEEVVVDDAQVRDLGDDALGDGGGLDDRGALLAAALAAGAAPVELADVELVAQDADVDALGPGDGAGAPGAALGRRHALGVEGLADVDGADAGDVVREDAPHDGGLVGIDLPEAVLAVGREDLAVAVGDRAADAAALDGALLAPAGLQGQALDEVLVLHGREGDLVVADHAGGDGADAHVEELQLL